MEQLENCWSCDWLYNDQPALSFRSINIGLFSSCIHQFIRMLSSTEDKANDIPGHVFPREVTRPSRSKVTRRLSGTPGLRNRGQGLKGWVVWKTWQGRKRFCLRDSRQEDEAHSASEELDDGKAKKWTNWVSRRTALCDPGALCCPCAIANQTDEIFGDTSVENISGTIGRSRRVKRLFTTASRINLLFDYTIFQDKTAGSPSALHRTASTGR
eukprot:758377-Hanusia_phi.AAC.7